MTTRSLQLPANDTPIDSAFLIWKDAHRAHHMELGEFLHIGRDPSNHISADDEFISGRHARIERREGKYVLKDLRSRNGTFVNGAKVLEAVLRDGDRIRIGTAEYRFTFQKDVVELPKLESKNHSWQSQLNRLPLIAQSEFPILISGPSGSGKDILAQNIHRLSNRTSGPFVGVNCSALSEALVESELFGHVRGSFTGATGDRKGAFEAARGGTLFLDEVGDLPGPLQPKLLRALENCQIRPVGSDRSVPTDVRVIAATHRDLKRLVIEGLFREDLFFRLHVIQLKSPALRDRSEDFEDLFYYFAKQMRVRFSQNAILALKAYDWPGNIRELRNVVARAKGFFGDSEVLEENIPFLIDTPSRQKTTQHAAFETKPARSILKEIEFEMIKSRLRANRGNQRRTASDLNMAKSTLSDKIRHFKIDVDQLCSD